MQLHHLTPTRTADTTAGPYGKSNNKRPRNVKLQVKQRLCGSESRFDKSKIEQTKTSSCLIASINMHAEGVRMWVIYCVNSCGIHRNLDSSPMCFTIQLERWQISSRPSHALSYVSLLLPHDVALPLPTSAWLPIGGNRSFKLCMRSISRNHRLNLS